MAAKHICRVQVTSLQAPISFPVQCEICKEDFFVPYICYCEGIASFFLGEGVEPGSNRICPIHNTKGTIIEPDPAISRSRATRPTITSIQPSPAPFLDDTAKIGLSILAFIALAPLLASIVPQISLAGVLLALFSVALLWALYEVLARLLLWPFQDWRSTAQRSLSAAAPAPALAARRWFRRHSFLLFLAGFVCGAVVVALIAETFEGMRATIVQLATVSGASVALAAVLFYAGLAAVPAVSQWRRSHGMQGRVLTAERAALRAGLARALPLGIATVVVLAFAPALLQPTLVADFPLTVQAAIGLVINIIGTIVILLSETVTKHLWPDTDSSHASRP